jgi:hypothetical protein
MTTPAANNDSLADWAVEVTDPAPRDLGELAEWAADVTDRRDEDPSA